MRVYIRSGFLFAFFLVGLSCSSLEPMPPGDHVVGAPISEPANAILGNLVTEYGSSDGRWLRSMSPGCTQIWAAQFGYRAGVRRDREDVLAVGRRTADHESSEIRGLFWDALFGNLDENDPTLFGFPALLVSGALGGSGTDAWMFSMGLDRIDEFRNAADLRPRESAGLAAILAEVSRLVPERREERLGQARELAEGAAGREALAFFAWAAVARASGEESDIRRARDAESATCYRFDARSGELSPPASADEILSLHLATIHGLADLAQATRDSAVRDRAVALLEYVFSEAWFDGRFLIHDRFGGEASKEVCSGCNFMALYLVDRLYGDSFVIEPVPELPVRDWPEVKRRRGIDRKLVLEPADDGEPAASDFELSSLGPEGRLLLTHASRDIRITFEYRVLPLEEIAPLGGVEAKFTRRGEDAKYKGTWTHSLPFDADGVARLGGFYGFEPLAFDVEFRKSGDGGLSATVRLREVPPQGR